MTQLAKTIVDQLKIAANPNKASFLQGFFKSGAGEYAEGDTFLGVTVPAQRVISKNYWTEASLSDIQDLLASPLHEARLTALIMLVAMFKKAQPGLKKEIFEFYLDHTHQINNWDLVDVSARDIVGGYLLTQPKPLTTLTKLAKSPLLWDRRVAMIATYAFIKAKQTLPTFEIALLLMKDPHDLIHKAGGWMLRETGKIDLKALSAFLDRYAATMPRTMLRYAIEKYPPTQRQHYLQLKALKG